MIIKILAVLFLLGIFIYSFLFTGEVDAIFDKSVRICFECIGLG